MDIMINSVFLPFRFCLLVELIIEFVNFVLCPFYLCCFLVGRVFKTQARSVVVCLMTGNIG